VKYDSEIATLEKIHAFESFVQARNHVKYHADKIKEKDMVKNVYHSEKLVVQHTISVHKIRFIHVASRQDASIFHLLRRNDFRRVCCQPHQCRIMW
jgi:hypothetical protein